MSGTFRAVSGLLVHSATAQPEPAREARAPHVQGHLHALFFRRCCPRFTFGIGHLHRTVLVLFLAAILQEMLSIKPLRLPTYVPSGLILVYRVGS